LRFNSRNPSKQKLHLQTDPPIAASAASFNHDSYSDDYIAGILNTVKTVAIVGASANDVRPSFFVAKYLIDKGFTVFPVNPGHAGKEILCRMTYAKLSDIPEPIDMVDIFRTSKAVPRVVDAVLALRPLPKVIWMQLTVRNDEAAAKAEAAGVKVVMNRCPKIEYGRLSGEIGWSGVNSRVLSSKRPVMRQGFQSFGVRVK
jgi:predicted CoA-binding protein